MKILFLTKYDDLAASARYRVLQFLPFLQEEGVECTVSPLFDNRYLNRIFMSRSPSIADYLSAFTRRLGILMKACEYDLVVLQYELFPYLPFPLERLLSRRFPYVYDYDDAIFASYENHRNPLARFFLRGKIADVIRGSVSAIAGNSFLARFAQGAGKEVSILPTVVDTNRYRMKSEPDQQGKSFTIGWIGSPSTTEFLNVVRPVLEPFCSQTGSRVVLVGAGPVDLGEVPLENRQWSEEREVDEICRFDVGIMPLPDTCWTRGKCGFKLIQYMACGIPVIASPVGMNCEIVEHGRNGFLASTPEEWTEALSALHGDADLRKRLGRNARTKVEKEYSLDVIAPRYLSHLRNAMRESL